MKAKNWLTVWFSIVLMSFVIIGSIVYYIDPLFHYHKPVTDKYYYSLDNERYQNDGIVKHFDYDSIITGTSMTANFKSSQANELFGGEFIKLPFLGVSYKEINDNLKRAFEANPNIKVVIRGIDPAKFCFYENIEEIEDVKLPTYLYDKNPLNDVEYLLNKDIIFGRIDSILIYKRAGQSPPGITSFDDYQFLQFTYVCGKDTVCPNGLSVAIPDEYYHLTEEEKDLIEKNIRLNVTGIADEHPDTTFYYFYPPYSIAWWNQCVNDGAVYRQIEAERFVTELILEHPNIKLFSFNNRTDITTDLNNYNDEHHYGAWINSLMLRWMHDGDYQLTKDNCDEYFEKEYDFYTSYDYSSVNSQIDYEADYYAAALLNSEFTGATPKELVGSNGIEEFEYEIDLDDGYNYLCFWGQKIQEQDCLAVYIFDEEDQLVEDLQMDYSRLDNEKHQYAMDLSDLSGCVRIVFGNDYMNDTDDLESEYIYSDIWIY